MLSAIDYGGKRIKNNDECSQQHFEDNNTGNYQYFIQIQFYDFIEFNVRIIYRVTLTVPTSEFVALVKYRWIKKKLTHKSSYVHLSIIEINKLSIIGIDYQQIEN